MLKEAKDFGLIRGAKVSERESISHLLFIDDIFYCSYGALSDIRSLKGAMDILFLSTGMTINFDKSCLILHQCSSQESRYIGDLIPSPRCNLTKGFK
jgi:hypothetical protein